MPTPQGDQRTLDQLKEHYLIERELSDKLRNASREERLHLYAALYDELYRRVPLHPQLSRKESKERSDSAVAAQMSFIRRFLHPNTVFMEVGAGDCALSIAVSDKARHVYAIDVSREIAASTDIPQNFELILSNGVDIPLPENSVDVAYSNQLMEHLHPEDALEQLKGIYRTLSPGGLYICITPNRLNGPHDISTYFDRVATGFHLREYTMTELSALFKDAGFSKTSALVGGRGRYIQTSLIPVMMCEKLLTSAPYRIRRLAASRLPIRILLNAAVVARK